MLDPEKMSYPQMRSMAYGENVRNWRGKKGNANKRLSSLIREGLRMDADQRAKMEMERYKARNKFDGGPGIGAGGAPGLGP